MPECPHHDHHENEPGSDADKGRDHQREDDLLQTCPVKRGNPGMSDNRPHYAADDSVG